MFRDGTSVVCVEECLEFVEREVSRHVGIVQVDKRLFCVSIRRCVDVANVHVEQNLRGADFHVIVLVEHVECFDVRCYWEDTVGVCVEECLEFVEREVSRHVGIVQVDNRLECVSILR